LELIYLGITNNHPSASSIVGVLSTQNISQESSHIWLDDATNPTTILEHTRYLSQIGNEEIGTV